MVVAAATQLMIAPTPGAIQNPKPTPATEFLAVGAGPSSGLLNASFEAYGSGLRGYNYRLLAALE